MRDDRVAVLHVGLLHRDEHDFGVVALDDEVGGIREQRVVLVRVDVGSRRTGLSDGESDEVRSKSTPSACSASIGKLLGLEQECGIGGQVDLPR